MFDEPGSPVFLLFWTFAIALSLYALLVVQLRGPEDPPFAAVVRPLCVAYTRIFHRLRFVSPVKNPVPAEGPAILVSNHRSGVDPLLLGVVTRRRVRFLMAREYYETWGLEWAFRLLGCIPVNRDGSDLGATKAALKALRAGEVIGIFPQGGIREAGSSLEGKAGAALLCLRTGAPVVPFYIDGSPNLDSVFLSLITPSHTTVTCGMPLLLGQGKEQKSSREELEGVFASILGAIEKLNPVACASPLAAPDSPRPAANAL